MGPRSPWASFPRRSLRGWPRSWCTTWTTRPAGSTSAAVVAAEKMWSGTGARAMALDRVFHVGCFVCSACGAQLRGPAFLRRGEEGVLWELLCGHPGEALHVLPAHPGPDSAGYGESLASGLLHLYGVPPRPGRHSFHCGCHEPDPLHRGLPQEVCPKMLSMWWGHHAWARSGGDPANRSSGSQFSHWLLKVWGVWAAAVLWGWVSGLLTTGWAHLVQDLQCLADPGALGHRHHWLLSLPRSTCCALPSHPPPSPTTTFITLSPNVVSSFSSHEITTLPEFTKKRQIQGELANYYLVLAAII